MYSRRWLRWIDAVDRDLGRCVALIFLIVV